jgi:hypothetical protein
MKLKMSAAIPAACFQFGERDMVFSFAILQAFDERGFHGAPDLTQFTLARAEIELSRNCKI